MILPIPNFPSFVFQFFPALLSHIFIPTGFFFLHLSMMFFYFLPMNSSSGHYLFSHIIFLHSHINNNIHDNNFFLMYILLLNYLYPVWTTPLQILTLLPSLIEWPLSCDHLFLLPLLFSFPSLYLARRTSFPPWVQQTPV